jgi:hypothetical protein
VLVANMAPVSDWTYLPARVEFPIFVQEVLRYLSGNPDAPANLDVGDTFRQPAYTAADHLLLRYPDGKRVRVHPAPAEENAEFRMLTFRETTQQGIYEFDAVEDVLARRRFVVNQTSEEADLARLDQSGFGRKFSSGGWRWIGPEVSLSELVSKEHDIKELAKYVLWILAAVLALESFLAARFGRRRGGVTT